MADSDEDLDRDLTVDEIAATADTAGRLQRLEVELIENRRMLDEVSSATASVEGRALAETTGAVDWEYTRSTAGVVLSAVRLNPGSTNLTLTGLAAGEQFVEALLQQEPPGSPLHDVLERFVNLNIETLDLVLSEGSPTAAAGMLSLVRGFYAEDLVLAGVVEGWLPAAPAGVEVKSVNMADTTNMPGHDLVIETDHGELLAQVKVGASGRAILDHFESYPDVQVVYATSDAAEAVRGAATGNGPVTVISSGDEWTKMTGPVVVDIGAGSSELTAETVAAVEATVSEGNVDFDLDAMGLLSELPLLALSLVVYRASRDYISTDDDAALIRSDALRAGGSVLVNNSVGTLLGVVTGADLLKPIGTIGSSIVRSAYRLRQRSLESSYLRLDVLRGRFARLARRATR